MKLARKLAFVVLISSACAFSACARNSACCGACAKGQPCQCQPCCDACGRGDPCECR